VALALEVPPRINNEARRVDIAVDNAMLLDLQTLRRVNVAFEPAGDTDEPGIDLSLDFALVGHDDGGRRLDLPLK